MVFRVIIFSSRKPGISPIEFQEYYDTKHVPLLKRVTGSAFPTTHVRRYVARPPVEDAPEGATERNNKSPAIVIWGKQSDFDYDVIAELTFPDQTTFQAFGAALNSPDNDKEISAMEEAFIDTTQNSAVVLGDVVETKGQATNGAIEMNDER